MSQESKRTSNPGKIVSLEKRIEALENCLAKVCHFTGTERVMDEFSIPRWQVGKKDMRFYND